MSNAMVNNVRLSVNRTSVVRTHADMFGFDDIGVKATSAFPKYVTIGVTGAFALNTATEAFSYYKPNTTGLTDDLTIVRGNHQYGIGGAFSASGWKTESNVRAMGPISFNGGVTGLPLGDFLLGRMFEYRQATPFHQDITQNYVALYGQDTWHLSSHVTLNYGARWEPWFPQNSADGNFYNFDATRYRNNVHSTVFPGAPAGLYYPGDPGFPGKTGMRTVWTNVAPRLGISWDPKGDGRTALRAGYGMTGDFVSGQFFFDSKSAPPYGFSSGSPTPCWTIRGAPSDERTRSRSPRSAPRASRLRPTCTRCTSRCRMTSRRRATTAGTSRCSSRSATTWQCR